MVMQHLTEFPILTMKKQSQRDLSRPEGQTEVITSPMLATMTPKVWTRNGDVETGNDFKVMHKTRHEALRGSQIEMAVKGRVYVHY